MPDDTVGHKNAASLQQALDLLDTLDDATYTRRVPECFEGWIGAHIRHLHDFYALLLRGASEGQVDYDARERDPRLETDRQYAINKLSGLIEALGELRQDAADRPLQARMDCPGDAPEGGWNQSTIGRELALLAFHDVHHYALIAFMLRGMDIQPPPGFGVAPSTVAYEREQESQ
jgi:uncharacterized damage-inducible protein DinB